MSTYDLSTAIGKARLAAGDTDIENRNLHGRRMGGLA